MWALTFEAEPALERMGGGAEAPRTAGIVTVEAERCLAYSIQSGPEQGPGPHRPTLQGPQAQTAHFQR